MKEIVIKIPDKVYESVIEEGFSVRNARELIHAMVNGKVLPKGHGELITKGQAVALVQFYQQNPQHFSFENLIDDIDKEKPLIETDETINQPRKETQNDYQQRRIRQKS